MLLGNATTIGPNLAAALRYALPASVTLERLEGGSTYDSAAKTLAFFTPSGTVYVATGAAFADGLAGGAWAARQGSPVVMVPPTGALPASVRSALARLVPTTIVILGGPAAVSRAVENELAQFLPA